MPPSVACLLSRDACEKRVLAQGLAPKVTGDSYIPSGIGYIVSS